MTALSPRLWRWRGEFCSSSASSSSADSSSVSPLSETYSTLSTLPSWLPSSSSAGFPFETGEYQLVHSCTKHSRQRQSAVQEMQ